MPAAKGPPSSFLACSVQHSRVQVVGAWAPVRCSRACLLPCSRRLPACLWCVCEEYVWSLPVGALPARGCCSSCRPGACIAADHALAGPEAAAVCALCHQAAVCSLDRPCCRRQPSMLRGLGGRSVAGSSWRVGSSAWVCCRAHVPAGEVGGGTGDVPHVATAILHSPVEGPWGTWKGTAACVWYMFLCGCCCVFSALHAGSSRVATCPGLPENASLEGPRQAGVQQTPCFECGGGAGRQHPRGEHVLQQQRESVWAGSMTIAH